MKPRGTLRGEGCVFERPGPFLWNPERIRFGRSVRLGGAVRMQVNVGDPSADPWIIVGDGVIIGAGSQLSASAGIVLEAGVRLGEEVLILDNTHTYEDPSTPIPLQPVRVGGPIRIGPGVYVGRGAVILMGVTIGEDAVIADRSVVQHDVPPRAWVAGCPARAVPPPPREPAR